LYYTTHFGLSDHVGVARSEEGADEGTKKKAPKCGEFATGGEKHEEAEPVKKAKEAGAKKAKPPKAASTPVVKPGALEVAAQEGYDGEMILKRSGKESPAAYLEKRLATLDGKSVAWALNEYRYSDTHGEARARVSVRFRVPLLLPVVTEMVAAGKPKKYNWADLKYDIKSLFFKAITLYSPSIYPLCTNLGSSRQAHSHT